MHRQHLAIALLIPFALLSLYAVSKVGYFGVLDYHRHSPAGWQVFIDLVVACVLVLVWMVPEAKRRKIAVWPYILATVLLGSIGPLLYLAIHGRPTED